jgi:hypothetical protein
MSNPGNPGIPPEQNNRPGSQPWAWEPSGPSSSPPGRAEYMSASAPRNTNVARRSLTSPLATYVAIFVLGAILGASAGYVGATASQRASASPRLTPTSATSPITYVVIGVSGTSILTIQSNNGYHVMIHTTSTTSYQRAGLQGTFSDITVGLQLVVKGHINTVFSVTADTISVQDTRISGKIQSMSAANDTLTMLSGTEQFVVAFNAHTKFANGHTHQPLEQTALTVGSQIRAYGSFSAVGSFDAAVITLQS